jgi:hypothetical protein
MDRKLRVRLTSFTTAVGLLTALALGVASSRADDPGTTFDQTYTSVGETLFDVPAGVTAIDVVATGGRGASVSNINSNPVITAAGGFGATVTGHLTNLTPGQVLFLQVGGNGTAGGIHSAGTGGFNGGGNALVETTAFDHFYNTGGGGGGASDIRTAPRADGLSPDTRLIVASGGGGGGHTVNSSTATGGNGGAGWSGSGAAGLGGARGASTGGDGGHGASSSAGGGAGELGSGAAGTDGSLGQGGNGGSGPNNNPGGGGGGGGGGRYGGGGGRGGSDGTGGGGGGGGSSLVPPGGTVETAISSNGSIEISYSIPGTDIDSGPSGSTTETTATFDFSSNDPDATFECRFDSTDDADFAPCTSPYTAEDLALGQHTFDVRAVNAVGNFDPTAASRTFTVETVPPPTTTTPSTTTPSGPGVGPAKAKCKKKKKHGKKAEAAKKKRCKKKGKKK